MFPHWLFVFLIAWQLKTQSHILYYSLFFFSQVLSSHFTGIWITSYFYCRVVKRHITILQMEITRAGANSTHRGGLAGTAGAGTWAGHSWERKTALRHRSSCAEHALWSSCKWTRVWCCGVWFAIIGIPHGYLRALCLCALQTYLQLLKEVLNVSCFCSVTNLFSDFFLRMKLI